MADGFTDKCRRCGRTLAPLEGGWAMDGCCASCYDPNDRLSSHVGYLMPDGTVSEPDEPMARSRWRPEA